MDKEITIFDFIDSSAFISPECRINLVYERFQSDARLLVLAVVADNGDVLGMVERQEFSLNIDAQSQATECGSKLIKTVMNTQPIMVDISTSVTDFTQTCLNSDAYQLMRGFIATDKGRFVGVGTLISLLKAVNSHLQTSLNEQTSLSKELSKANARALRQEVFLNMVIQHVPALIAVKNAVTKRYMLVNQTWSKMVGKSAEQVIGLTGHEIFPKPQADHNEYHDEIALASHGPIIIHEEKNFGVDDETHVVQVKKIVLRDEDGNADSILTFGVDLTDQKRAQAKITQLAHYDSLTGLGNRSLFSIEMEKALSRAQRTDRNVALFCLDLDRFKSVNDSYGHVMGDKLLIEVAERLRYCVRKSDHISRMGGDEFTIIQEIAHISDAQVLATRVVESLKTPFIIDDIRLDIGVSIGIAIAPTDGLDSLNLLSRADLAMYRVKNDGRNNYCFYQPDMESHIQERLHMEQDLKLALNEGQFELYFQPQLSLASQTIEAFEALIRWHHPSRGMVSPAEFIPMAEDLGLIGSIGEWVLYTACQTATTWPSCYNIAVNISPIQFKNGQLVELVTKILKDTGLAAHRLELEITESVILEGAQKNLNTLNELSHLGVKIAMDDFGTGYSSLSYLRTFKFDRIKIDRSFVRDLPQDQSAMSIIKAITDMAQTLGVRITAEGVETKEQLQALQTLNCDEIQGFYIGRPSPDISQYLKFTSNEGAIMPLPHISSSAA